MNYSKPILFGLVMAMVLPGYSLHALAAGSHEHSHGGHHGESTAKTESEQPNIGSKGTLSLVTRAVTITMHDNYYEPEKITVSPGQTIRFFIKNEGEFLHEFSIATPEMHVAHQPHMAMMFEHGALEPDRINHEMMKAGGEGGHSMAHDDPNSVLVEPGKSAELVWTFPKGGSLEFACNIPGHYQSGMAGPVDIK